MKYEIRVGHKSDQFFIIVPAIDGMVGGSDYSIIYVCYSRTKAEQWIADVKNRQLFTED